MSTQAARVFIGSSKEGLGIAEQVQTELSDIAECHVWTTSFEIGNSAYEDLIKKLSLFDYGILIASADDVSQSRGVEKLSPRDNIIFEFGLFAGRLGRQRSFLLAEAGIKIPSDLNGVTLSFFPSCKRNGFFALNRSRSDGLKKQKEGIKKCCDQIREHIRRRNNIFDFGFLPSTSLAFGYYNNFVLKAITSLLDTKTLKLGNSEIEPVRFADVSLTILIPGSLSADMFDQVKAHCTKHKWQLAKIDAGGFRPFDFYIQAERRSDNVLGLMDIPLTLNALNESIKAYVGKSYVGVSDAESLLEKREINLFRSVLNYLISTNPVTKERVTTELVNI